MSHFERDLAWTRRHMPLTRAQLTSLPSLDGVRLACSVHLEPKMTPVIETLLEHGAAVFLTSCNRTTVRDEMVQYLVSRGAEAHAWSGMSSSDEDDAAAKAIDWKPTHLCEMLSLHGKRVVVVGFGLVGHGIAECARAFGGTVSVAERDAARLLQARYAGFEAAALEELAPRADVIVTATGVKHVLNASHKRARANDLPIRRWLDGKPHRGPRRHAQRFRPHVGDDGRRAWFHLHRRSAVLPRRGDGSTQACMATGRRPGSDLVADRELSELLREGFVFSWKPHGDAHVAVHVERLAHRDLLFL